MPKLNACDYSYPADGVPLDEFARRLVAAGITAVQRYLFDGGKGITPAERKALLGAGVGIAYGYEGYASNWRGGAAQGHIDGAHAVTLAKKLGVPKGCAIYYAVDEDAPGMGMTDTALAYVRAADHPNYPARAYGAYGVIEALGLPGFQTYAWSGGQVSKHAALYQWNNGQQLAGATVDFGEVIDPQALGAEWPAGSNQGDDPLAGFTLEQIAEAVWAQKAKSADGQEHRMDVHVQLARQQAGVAADHAKTVAKVVATLPARVAATQKAIAALATEVTVVRKTVAAIEPVTQTAVDVAAIAAATSAHVIAKLKTLAFRAGA